MSKNLLSGAVFVVLIALFAFAANDWKLPGPAIVHGADWCGPHNIELSKCET